MLHPVPSRLRGVVSAIWTLDAGDTRWTETVWATLTPDLVIASTPFERNGERILCHCVDGVTLRPREYLHHGRDRLTGVQFVPGGLHALLPDVSAAREAPHEVATVRLPPDLAPSARAAAMARWLLANVEIRPRGGLLLHALERHARVVDAAADLGLTERSLRRHALRHFGLTPKEVQRVARFRRAVALRGESTSLADVAYAAGYADQAHLTREWSAMAGLPPSAC